MQPSFNGTDEYPIHTVSVSLIWMDASEVTNTQFKKFVEATNFVTTAEFKEDRNQISQIIPPTAKSSDNVIVPASLVLNKQERKSNKMISIKPSVPT